MHVWSQVHSPNDHYKNTWCEMRRKENKANILFLSTENWSYSIFWWISSQVLQIRAGKPLKHQIYIPTRLYYTKGTVFPWSGRSFLPAPHPHPTKPFWPGLFKKLLLWNHFQMLLFCIFQIWLVQRCPKCWKFSMFGWIFTSSGAHTAYSLNFGMD